MKKLFTLFVLFVFSFNLSACATMFSGKAETVSIDSETENVNVTIQNKNGNTVFLGTTPAKVVLPKRTDDKETELYTVTLEKEGYATSTHTIDANNISGWFWFNIVALSIGGLLVDGITGSLYKLLPTEINTTLEKTE